MDFYSCPLCGGPAAGFYDNCDDYNVCWIQCNNCFETSPFIVCDHEPCWDQAYFDWEHSLSLLS